MVVRVLTNSLATTDVPAAHAAYARHRPELLALGVELHELRATPSRRSAFLGSSKSSRSSLHAKAILVDGHVLFVGSMNLDPRSAVENTEVGLLIDSADLGAQMSRIFARGVRLGSAQLSSMTAISNSRGIIGRAETASTFAIVTTREL